MFQPVSISRRTRSAVLGSSLGQSSTRVPRRETRCACSEQSARDRRYKSIRATEKAYRLKDELAEVETESFSWLCRGLDPQQIQELMNITDLMLQNAWDENHTKGGSCGCD